MPLALGISSEGAPEYRVVRKRYHHEYQPFRALYGRHNHHLQFTMYDFSVVDVNYAATYGAIICAAHMYVGFHPTLYYAVLSGLVHGTWYMVRGTWHMVH